MSKFIKEDVETMLRNHKKNEAKLTEVQLKKEEYQERQKKLLEEQKIEAARVKRQKLIEEIKNDYHK